MRESFAGAIAATIRTTGTELTLAYASPAESVKSSCQLLQGNGLISIFRSGNRGRLSVKLAFYRSSEASYRYQAAQVGDWYRSIREVAPDHVDSHRDSWTRLSDRVCAVIQCRGGAEEAENGRQNVADLFVFLTLLCVLTPLGGFGALIESLQNIRLWLTRTQRFDQGFGGRKLQALRKRRQRETECLFA